MNKPEKRDASWAAEFERVSRRSFIGVGGAVTAAALTGLSLEFSAGRANATTALDLAIAEALSFEGKTESDVLAYMNGISPGLSWLQPPYPPSQWCVWFATFIARATGIGVVTGSSALYYNHGLPTSSSPHPGDFIYYVNSQTTGHTGFVVGVTGGVAQTIEGNQPANPSTIHYHSSPWGGVVGYATPNWAGIAPSPQEATILGDDLTDILYYVTGSSTYTTNGVKTPAVAVVPDSVWYQECPGAPLFKLASSAAASAEYNAFYGARLGNAAATRYAADATVVGALIEIRGQSLQPTASLAPLRTT